MSKTTRVFVTNGNVISQTLWSGLVESSPVWNTHERDWHLSEKEWDTKGWEMVLTQEVLIIGHYHSYFINEIKLILSHVYVKSHLFKKNLIKSGVILIDIYVWNLKFLSRDLLMHFVVELQCFNEILKYFLSNDEI